MPTGTAASTVRRMRTCAVLGLVSGSTLCFAAMGNTRRVCDVRPLPERVISVALPRSAPRGTMAVMEGGAAPTRPESIANQAARTAKKPQPARDNVPWLLIVQDLRGQFLPMRGTA